MIGDFYKVSEDNFMMGKKVKYVGYLNGEDFFKFFLGIGKVI